MSLIRRNISSNSNKMNTYFNVISNPAPRNFYHQQQHSQIVTFLYLWDLFINSSVVFLFNAQKILCFTICYPRKTIHKSHKHMCF